MQEFEALKVGFELCTRIAGTFMFARTIDMGAWLYFSASYLLFNDESSGLS